MSMTARRSALATLIQTTLDAIEAGWRVDQHMRSVVLRGAQARDRKRVMGDPTRYVAVYHVAPEFIRTTNATDARERPMFTRDVFSVQVWYEYKDHDTLAYSSEATWNSLITADSGLLDTLRDTAWLDTPASALGLPEGITIDIVALNGSQDLAHFCSFTISVE